jgi:hypothetical protein
LPCPGWVTDASTALDATAVLVAVATFLSAAELLALRAEFSSHGLFDARVLTSTRRGVLAGRFTVVSTPRIAGLQLVLAVSVVVFLAFDISPSVPLVGLAAAAALQRVLLPYGRDGSDELGRILTITAGIAFLAAEDTYVVRIGLGFIAAQLCLSYAASGVAKLFGRQWRSGTAVPAILHTAFGHEGITRSALDRRPAVGKALTWLVIVFELAIPVGVVLGGWVALVALAGAAAFHLGIAVSMGLNRFAPWFFAAFPATAWAACHYGLLSR